MLHDAWIEYCNIIHKNSERYWVALNKIKYKLGENMKNSLS